MAVFSDCPREFMFPDLLSSTKPSSDPHLSPSSSWNSHQNYVKELPQKAVIEVSPLNKSFAQAISNPIDFSLSQLPRPCVKGDSISIKIFEDEYKIGLECAKSCLDGRLLIRKGNQPMKANDLRSKLSAHWKPVAQWRMTPLGKGFFEFDFSSQDDL